MATQVEMEITHLNARLKSDCIPPFKVHFPSCIINVTHLIGAVGDWC